MAARRVACRPERAVCVTGMHRSGTSFTARALQNLGVSLGDPDRLMAPGPDNPAGYWENRDIKELNDELLARMGGSWDQPPVLNRGWEENADLDSLRARASDVLDDAFGAPRPGRDIIGWKDPRLSLLLPFWRVVTPITTTVVVVRDPAEVSASLRARNGIEAPHTAMLWLRYVFAATANDPGHLLVRDRDFFVDLPGTLVALATHVGLPPPGRDVVEGAGKHLDLSLRHHVAPAADPADENPLVALASAVWNRGSLDLEAVPDVVAEGIRWGWLRPPIDGELLARSRAQAVQLRDRIRRRRRQEIAAQNAVDQGANARVHTAAVSLGGGSTQPEDDDE
jgi:hypothetical protein